MLLLCTHTRLEVGVVTWPGPPKREGTLKVIEVFVLLKTKRFQFLLAKCSSPALALARKYRGGTR